MSSSDAAMAHFASAAASLRSELVSLPASGPATTPTFGIIPTTFSTAIGASCLAIGAAIFATDVRMFRKPPNENGSVMVLSIEGDEVDAFPGAAALRADFAARLARLAMLMMTMMTGSPKSCWVSDMQPACRIGRPPSVRAASAHRR
jgi:hypothetical protein